MRLNIQTKLVITLAGLTIIILAGVLYLVTDTLTNKIEEKIINDFNNTQWVFSELQFLVYDRLDESSYLIGENCGVSIFTRTAIKYQDVFFHRRAPRKGCYK